MAEKAMFESIRTVPPLLKKKKKTFTEKAKQRAVIKFCAGIGNTPTEKEISETVGKNIRM